MGSFCVSLKAARPQPCAYRSSKSKNVFDLGIFWLDLVGDCLSRISLISVRLRCGGASCSNSVKNSLGNVIVESSARFWQNSKCKSGRRGAIISGGSSIDDGVAVNMCVFAFRQAARAFGPSVSPPEM
jgi:hypothetical protein